ncbi:selenocysteine-specific translation elongation factor [Egibacter rhizosphaerae]|uniref:Selenocysteine-specific translation elongation factor n=1 Tax=Egibacter rhizosphaerae TaxID=1670831 RepID=A0A411YE34_9ACTN|nr:selenocysteine-specific translation elongation factor [Egibacter rhizosphaerae]QBI19446.1 selenocysteine-specific translation elongation factor [Egibacter rhizosphaerae]
MRVVCTAGHVDHGKSTLVRALTGTEPDRFAEEQERGLTIDLGFAWTDLTPGEADPRTVAFVDLPGHERFVGNMLAGAGSVTLALLVVAADEGWMPQSREHMQILDLLGVRHGVVAITKTDAVDAETTELAVELVREELAGTGLHDAPIVPVSGASGDGLEELRSRLRDLVTTAPEPADVGRPRLWVDRAFTISGAGTVVTGTLLGGAVEVGETLAVLPDGPRGRVRGLQQLGRDTRVARPGSRVAINLARIERGAVPRGTAVGRADAWLPVAEFEARVRALPGAELGSRGAWKLHAGTAVVPAGLAPIGRPARGDDPEGPEAPCRITLDEPLPLAAGDRFVLRESGRDATLGGGIVLDAAPPHRRRGRAARERRSTVLTERERALAAGDRVALVVAHVTERGLAAPSHAAAAVGGTRADVAAAELLPVGEQVADPAAVARWGDEVVSALAAHHTDHPVQATAPKALAIDAAVRAGCPRANAEDLLATLHAQGRIVLEGPGARIPDHRVVLSEEEARARDELLSALRDSPFAPPPLSSLARDAGASTALVRELERRGEIVRLGEDLALAADAIEDAHARLHAAFVSEGPLTAARAKDVLATTRKFALPLLELLDKRGATRRVGDEREVQAP